MLIGLQGPAKGSYHDYYYLRAPPGILLLICPFRLQRPCFGISLRFTVVGKSKNMSNEQNFRSFQMLNSRIMDLLFHYYFQF